MKQTRGRMSDGALRKKAKEALRESEERFRLTFDQSPIGALIADPLDFHWVRANKAFCHFIGYSENELTRLTYADITHPDDLALISEQTRRLVAGEISRFEAEKRYIRKDGSVVWGHLLVQAVKDRTGGLLYSLGMIQDVTERKRTDQALRESEERYRTVIEHSNDGVVITREGRHIYVSQRFLDMFGYNGPEEVVGKSITEAKHVHPEDRGWLAEMNRKRPMGEFTPSRYEHRAIGKNGSLLYVEASATRIMHQGEPASLSYLRDVTERREAEEALKKERDKAQSYLDVAGVILLAIESDQTVSLINKKGCEVLECEEREVLGSNWFNTFLPERDKERVKAVFVQLMAGELEPVEYMENAVLTRSGRERVMAWHNTFLRDQVGKIVRTLSSGQDITDRVQAGLRLRDSEEALKSLLNATSDVACLVDTRGTVIAANGVVAQSLGRDLDHLIGQNIFDLFPKEIAHSRRLWAQKVIETGKPVRDEDSFTDNRYFDTCVYPVFDAEGKVVRLAIFAKDITEAKQASQALAESEARFRQFFDNVNDGISVRDAGTFELLDANHRFCEMWGYTLDELRRLPLGTLGAHESVDERRKRLISYYRQAADGLPSLFQWAARRKDGSNFWVELNVTKITVGTRECLLTVVRDITEGRRAEENIKTSLDEKEVLLKEIHHRVKNNLQIVSSLLYLQGARTEHPGAISALRESRNRVRSMALIHERLYQSPNLASVDMGEYTRNLVSDLRHSHRTGDSAIRLTLNIEDIPLGINEAIPCGLIINELVSNALKHAFPEGRAGEVTIQLTRKSGDSYMLLVSDNGIGLPEHVDFRNSPSLGLTLINSLVKQLEGTVKLDRSSGTAFTITFGQ